MKEFGLQHPKFLGLVAAVATLLADQGTKLYFLYALHFSAMRPGEAIRVGPFFNLVMVWNRGVSFGLFPADSDAGRIFLLSFSALVVGGLVYWLWRTRDLMPITGIGLVIGGALGNMVDRLRYGAVADFFHLHAFGYNWYVFNVADAAIVGGVGLLLYESLLGRERPGPGRGLSHAHGEEAGQGSSKEG